MTMDCDTGLYALYKGDEFIALGTIYQLAELTGKTTKQLYWLATPANKNRGANRTALYRIEEDE